MKIIRDKEKKEKTPEEKELEAYKRAKNVGLASMGSGAAFYGISKLGEGFNKLPNGGNEKTRHISEGDINFEKAAAIGLGAIGLGLHGVGAVKYNKLKKELKKREKEENDSKTEKKD